MRDRMDPASTCLSWMTRRMMMTILMTLTLMKLVRTVICFSCSFHLTSHLLFVLALACGVLCVVVEIFILASFFSNQCQA